MSAQSRWRYRGSPRRRGALAHLPQLVTTYQPKWLILERVKGIEPSSSAWKAVALPLSYTRPFDSFLLLSAPQRSDLVVVEVGLEPTKT